ncbi:hypothetical protein [Candidatus Accumulibacter sp. ACC005]|uniref:hypothetical protein n=1 Tax=Candidatus Accumulibacter sp. ACC005 TaxID=2823331 RepID=UPI0025BAAFD2|nr:hypothetical protein [Candidatus Accumulibacter sp. ACC005]
MRDYANVTLMVGSILVVAACAAPDHVLFVTKTSIGIDLDSKPASASLAYDRVEGYMGPRYDNGEIPPVIASVKSDGAIFNPRIRQVYATGDAAEIVVKARADPAPSTERGPKLSGGKKLMFFGTATTTGLKVGFTTGLPDSLTFGFRRKEFSYIPIGTVGTGDDAYDVYPSILASIDTAATAGTASETGLRNAQFFATGQAARFLATNAQVRMDFENQAERSMDVASGLSQSETARALRLYANPPGITEEAEIDNRFRAIKEAYICVGGPDPDGLVIGSFIRDGRPATELWQAKVFRRLQESPLIPCSKG